MDSAKMELAEFRALVLRSDEVGLLGSLIFSHRKPEAEPVLDILRSLGWIHLGSLAGFHLILIREWVLRIGFLRRGSLRVVIEIFVILSAAALWSLQGFRIGFVRPFLLYLCSAGSELVGVRWGRGVLLLGVLAFDWILSLSLGVESGFGRAHYFLAVAGGAVGIWGLRYDAAQPFSRKLSLSVASWTWVAVYDGVSSGVLSLATPFLNLVSPLIFGWFLGGLVLGWIFDSASGIHFVVVSGNQAILELSKLAISFGGVRGIDLNLRCAMCLGVLGLGLAQSLRLPRLQLWVVLLALVVGGATQLSPGQPRAFQWNVGQGDSALLITHLGRYWFDFGPIESHSHRKWLERWATSPGSAGGDRFLISHFDQDHVGGLVAAAEIINPECVSWPAWDPSSTGVRQARQTLPACVARFDPELSILRVDSPGAGPQSPNGRMVGVWLKTSKFEYLNLGDATRSAERAWVGLQKESQRERAHPLRVLKLSHHGSKTSSDPRLLRWYRPDQVWISAGERNPFGHPSAEVVHRLKEVSPKAKEGRTQWGDLIVE